ncbi:hypothetical protein PPGU19_030590 [Paraburkholderia sp. PGU19]|nr:hypothetical protein PPGU19_030590 [Paraburkholderia sp. PGU19]
MMNAIRITADLRAQDPLRRRMIRLTDNLDRAAVVDGHAHRAGIGTVVGTDGAGEFGGSVHIGIEGQHE